MVSFRSNLAEGLIFVCIFGAATTQATDTNAVLDGWFAAQSSVHSIAADFVQTRTLKTLVQPLKSSGRLWFEPPNQFRWELGHPAQTIALRNGDDMYVIYPRLKRAEHYPLGASAPREWRSAMALLDAGFPRTRADFEAQFQIQSLTESEGKWQLDLQPKQAAARKIMPDLRVFLSTNGYELAGTELTFMDGSRMRNDFTKTEINAPVDEKIFQWKPPSDFTVTEPLGK